MAIHIELVFVPANQKILHLQLTLPVGSTIADAIDKSGVLQSHPEINHLAIGIFGKLVPLTHVVKSGDRIEIYRSLSIDPKEKRRQRAKTVKK